MALPRDSPPEIGSRLQGIRKARRLTLDQLARSSGLSKSMLSQIERGRVNPTLATLWNLTQALGIDIAGLLDGGGGENHCESGAVEHLAAHATPTIASADGKCRLRILSPPRAAQRFEWYEVTVQPGGELRSDAHAPGTLEHLTLLEGSLAVEIPGSPQPASPGETLRYAADQPHAIVNASASAARALLVVEFVTVA